MPRPVPQSHYLANLARRVQKTQKHVVQRPVLLDADRTRGYGIIAGSQDRHLHLFDCAKGRIFLDLPLPRRADRGADFICFTFDREYKHLAAYNRNTGFFSVWSMETGKHVAESEGKRKTAPTIAFLPNDEVAFADSPQISLHKIGKGEKSVSYVSNDLRSLRLYAPKEDDTLLFGLGVFLKGGVGLSISCFHIRDGQIVAGREGPYRSMPNDPAMRIRLLLHELLKLPGTDLLVALEEERLSLSSPNTGEILDEEYRTRLVAVNPISCKFESEERMLRGRFCLEYQDKELHLLDESGRRRLIKGIPLEAEPIDWRLGA